jgi:MFS family permease
VQSLRVTLQSRPHLRRLPRALGQLFAGARSPDQTERNAWYLTAEIGAAAVLSAAASFNAAFAVRLGASNTMIGWLSSIPSLLAMVMLIPSARFLESKTQRAPWVWGSLLIARLGYLLLAFLPWLIHSGRAEAVVWLLIAISVPSTFFSAGFNPLFTDVVPERERTRVLAARSMLSSGMVAALTYLAGRWLEASHRMGWATFPLNYQALFIIGFAGSMVSMALLLRIRVPASRAIPARKAAGGKPFWLQLRTLATENRNFSVLVLNTLLFDGPAYLIGPLYIILFVRELGASDGWIGLNATLANLGVIVGYWLWRRWIRRLGYSRALLLSAPLAALYPLLCSLVPNLSAILLWGILINLINPGISMSHFNILMKLCPEDRKTSYFATYATLANVVAFVGPMAGVALAGVFGIRAILLAGGVLRLLGGLAFSMLRVQVPEQEIR